MKNLILKTFLILFLLVSCDEIEKQSQVVLISQDKKVFLDRLDTNEQVKMLLYQLDSANISLKDIVNYCRSSNNPMQSIGLIQIACASMENNLEEQNYEYWAGILYDLKRFYENVTLLKNDKQKVFMDVGSGNGEKLFVALCLGFEQAIGIEYADSLVAIANRNLQLFTAENKAQNIHADAFEVKKEVYQEADFIYLYSPIKDNLTMARLTQKILNNMKDGAILLEVRFVYGEELAKLMNWQLPLSAGLFVIKKQDEKFYLAEYDHHQTRWKKIEKAK